MLDYAKWLQRAIQFAEQMRRVPYDIQIEIEVAPPLTEAEFQEIASGSRLPIPEPLHRFWTEASAHCHCSYRFVTPPEYYRQLAVVFPDRIPSGFCGGAEFQSARDSIMLATNDCPSWEEHLRPEFPKDARLWGHTIPLIPNGGGDFVGLYVRDEQENPPVAYICHDGYGGSNIIASSFDEFLTHWEQLGYLGVDFELLGAFANRRTRLIAPNSCPPGVRAIRSLLLGQVQFDIQAPAFQMTETEWMTSDDAEFMLKWLEKTMSLDERKLRLFCCALCRRVWDRMGDWSRRAVEVAERYADGRASQGELQSARSALAGGGRGAALQQEQQALGEETCQRALQSPANFFKTPDPVHADRFMKNLMEQVEFSKSQGLMHRVAYAAVDASTLVSWDITQHLDEPELALEKKAHADFIRHIFGNPFQPSANVDTYPFQIMSLAKRLYDGKDPATELRAALQEAKFADLAEHFERPDHPKGCWALDLILGR